MPNGQVFELLSSDLRRLLVETGLAAPTPPQVEAIPAILDGKNVLLIAPTGSGKTEAALLPIFSKLTELPEREGISLLYITPLRALNRDLFKRLIIWSAKLGFKAEVRHGDTPQKERRKQSLKPPDVLVTTPETLQAILPGRNMRKHLRHVRWVVIDEVHQLAGSRRGTQLAVGLERLRLVTDNDFQRIGLSATVGNPQEIAALIAGERPIDVVEVSPRKQARYFVEYPYPTEEDQVIAQSLFTGPEAAARLSRIAELIDEHRSTLIFVNSRQNAEMLGSKFVMLHRNVGVHHGSLPRNERITVENAFKTAQINALVCTSTLELGIDIGSVDFVVQYMSPRQVTNLIQRVGRSGHSLDRISAGTIIGVSTEDVLESIAACQMSLERRIEPIKTHKGALDVLAHQIAGLLLDLDRPASQSELYAHIAKAYAYAQLPENDFVKVLDFLRRMRRIRVTADVIEKTARTRQYYFENLSMIPDERRYFVVDVSTQTTVGVLGEEFMMLRARVGLHFIIKGRVWKIEKIAEDGNVYVSPVEDPTAAIPGWDGELLPVPYELAVRTAALRLQASELLKGTNESEAVETLTNIWPTERFAAKKIVAEISEHFGMGAPVPHANHLLLEAFDRFLVIHAPFGETVNNSIGEVVEELFARKALVRNWWSDGYRILFELTSNPTEQELADIQTDIFRTPSEKLEQVMHAVLHRHFPFGYYMKFIAERFGALRRGLFLGGEALKELALKFRLTPIYDETIREALMLHVDFDRVREIFAKVNSGEIAVSTFFAETNPSPLAYHILNKHLEVPELISPETVEKDNVHRMRLALANETVNLLCFECTHLNEGKLVGKLPERPVCEKCGSALLAVLFWTTALVAQALGKKRRKQTLEEHEEKALINARRGADLVLSYGKRAVTAQCVYGVGPQTAARVLAKMHDDEVDFFKDLLAAKLNFITTRPYWDSRS